MALSHNYHPQCGCYSCGRQESADDRLDEAAKALHANASILSEAMGELTSEQLAAMAIHLGAGDDIEFAAVMRRAIQDYVTEQIEIRMDQSSYSRAEAVAQMLKVYEVKPQRQAPVLIRPWERAA